MDVVRELSTFQTDLDEYAAILNELWQHAPGPGWLATATPQQQVT